MQVLARLAAVSAPYRPVQSQALYAQSMAQEIGAAGALKSLALDIDRPRPTQRG